jgi:hypothetical protein
VGPNEVGSGLGVAAMLACARTRFCIEQNYGPRAVAADHRNHCVFTYIFFRPHPFFARTFSVCALKIVACQVKSHVLAGCLYA